MTMSANRNLVTRRLPLFVFGAVATLGSLVVLAQVSPQPARPRGNAGPAAQNAAPQNAAPQNAAPQNQNQIAPATDQPTNQTTQPARDPRNQIRQPADDSRQRQSNQSDEQDAAWLGVFLSERDSDRGATVTHVYPAGPAARAGLHSGDVIQQIDGQPVNSGNDLVSALEQKHAGDKVEISVLRDNEPLKLTAKLGSRDSFISRNRPLDRSYGRGQIGQAQGSQGQSGQGGQYDENEDLYNIPLHAMELEHNRRMAEQHQRIESEIAQLRDEVRQLREALQKR